jgi:hypothetical protein
MIRIAGGRGAGFTLGPLPLDFVCRSAILGCVQIVNFGLPNILRGSRISLAELNTTRLNSLSSCFLVRVVESLFSGIEMVNYPIWTLLHRVSFARFGSSLKDPNSVVFK